MAFGPPQSPPRARPSRLLDAHAPDVCLCSARLFCTRSHVNAVLCKQVSDERRRETKLSLEPLVCSGMNSKIQFLPGCFPCFSSGSAVEGLGNSLFSMVTTNLFSLCAKSWMGSSASNCPLAPLAPSPPPLRPRMCTQNFRHICGEHEKTRPKSENIGCFLTQERSTYQLPSDIFAPANLFIYAYKFKRLSAHKLLCVHLNHIRIKLFL